MLELTKGKYFILIWHTIFLHICVCMNRDSGLNLYSKILIFGKHPSTLTAFELEASPIETLSLSFQCGKYSSCPVQQVDPGGFDGTRFLYSCSCHAAVSDFLLLSDPDS